jgi:YegS/Rv2252/BmrU family lipid kinase
MRKYIFIVNPNAGKKVADTLIQSIARHFPKNIEHEIVIWEDKDNFEIIKQKIRQNYYSHAIAVGGDGTVNEVANAILNTEIVLGIIPCGSGNGLARSLGISMQTEEAMREMVQSKSIMIDSGRVNDHAFFCTSGAGFDAHIGERFAHSSKRGFMSYVKITIRELFTYRSADYEIKINGEVLKRKAFLVTVANAGQYGNDFYIAPQASLTDGLFHVVILKPFHLLAAFPLAWKMFSGNAHTSKYIETHTAEEVTIVRATKSPIHFDGEPAIEEAQLHFKNLPRSIRIVSGANYKPAAEIL